MVKATEKSIIISGHALAEARRRKFPLFNQQRFAEHAGVSYGWIKTAEPMARRPVYLDTAKKLAAALEMSDAEFMAQIAVADSDTGIEFRTTDTLRRELIKQAEAVGKTPQQLFTEIMEAALRPPVAPKPEGKRKRA